MNKKKKSDKNSIKTKLRLVYEVPVPVWKQNYFLKLHDIMRGIRIDKIG